MRVVRMKSISLTLSNQAWAEVCQQAFEANQSEDDFLKDTLEDLFAER